VIRLRTATFACAFSLTASLLLARVHPFGNAGLFATRSPGKTSLLARSAVPVDVRSILIMKCADCHSEQTEAPLYGRFAPISWLMERDIIKGRKAMNLSLWESYSAEAQQTFVAKIVQETKSHEMPLIQYRMIHRDKSITDSNLIAISRWARTSSTSISSMTGQSIGLSPGRGDPVRGKGVFEKRCTGCHALTKDHEGPRLQGVFGRTSGSATDFDYSTALKKAHIVWGEDSLDQWLTDPDAMVPGNNMEFRVPKAEERRDLISFLKQCARV